MRLARPPRRWIRAAGWAMLPVAVLVCVWSGLQPQRIVERPDDLGWIGEAEMRRTYSGQGYASWTNRSRNLGFIATTALALAGALTVALTRHTKRARAESVGFGSWRFHVVIASWSLGIGIALALAAVTAENLEPRQPQTGITPKPAPRTVTDALPGGAVLAGAIYVSVSGLSPLVPMIIDIWRAPRRRHEAESRQLARLVRRGARGRELEPRT